MAITTGVYARLVTLAAVLPFVNALGCYSGGLLFEDLHGNLPGDRLDMNAEIKANINTVCDKIAGAEFKKTDPASPPFTHCSDWEVTLESPDDCCDGAFCPERCLGPEIGSFNRIEFEVKLKDDSQTTTMKKEWCIAAFELELSGCSSGSEQDDDNGFWYRIDPQSGGCPASSTTGDAPNPTAAPPASEEPTTMVTATSATDGTVGALARHHPQATPNEFLYEGYSRSSQSDMDKMNTVHAAFDRTWGDVVETAMWSTKNPNDPTIDKWFPQWAGSTDSRTYVYNVFDKLLQPGTEASDPIPRPLIAGFCSWKRDFDGKCRAGGPDAYLDERTGDFHICDYTLRDFPAKAASISCEALGDYVSAAWDSVTGVQVHEFTHSNQVGDLVPNSLGHITDYNDGYGPRNCYALRRSQRAFTNADSYTWFSLETYYRDRCQKSFGRPR